MNSINNKHHFGWGSFILGVLFVIGGGLVFYNPAESLLSLTTFIGIMAIAKGVFDIFLRDDIKQVTGFKGMFLIILGAFDILIGVLLLFNLTAGALALPFVFAIWFTADSIGGLFTLDVAKSVSDSYYWFSLIVSILGIIVGISLFIHPVAAAFTVSFLVGFYLFIFGITNIINAFSE